MLIINTYINCKIGPSTTSHIICSSSRCYSSDIPPSLLESIVEELISSSNSNTSFHYKYNIYYIIYTKELNLFWNKKFTKMYPQL